MERRRPRGIIIIAILMIISGIASIIMGIALMSLGWIFGQFAEADISGFTAIFVGTGAFTVALGIATLIISWGLLKGKSWAWLLTVIIAIISVIGAIASLASTGFWGHVVLLIIYGVIIYYMFTPDVKSYFGRAKIPK